MGTSRLCCNLRGALVAPCPFHLVLQSASLPVHEQGLAKARDAGFLEWQSNPCTWNLAEYEFYEQVENGDLNWILPGEAMPG